MKRLILGVGHCSFDTRLIGKAIEELGGVFLNISAPSEALKKLAEDCGCVLVLANRVIGGNERGGIDFIEALKADERLAGIPVMLLTAYADWQQQAVAKGAEPGFSKDLIDTERVKTRLVAYLGESCVAARGDGEGAE